jgi:phosphoribosylformylglycinamidine synthase
MFLLDFIGTRPLEEEVIVGPCGFAGQCTCGQCEVMTSQDRINLMLKGIAAMCENMGVFVVGGGFSTSFSDIVPATVVAVIGRQVTDKPLTKPAKSPGDKIIIIGETGTDGNDTLFRAGLASVMEPAVALFAEEKTTMEATLAAFATGKIKACSDLGAAGIGAAVCESARFGGLGARVELDQVPVRTAAISPEEVFICETQARMLLQVEPRHVAEVLEAIRSQNGTAAVIGEINDQDYNVFTYQGEVVATIPNKPSPEILKELMG